MRLSTKIIAQRTLTITIVLISNTLFYSNWLFIIPAPTTTPNTATNVSSTAMSEKKLNLILLFSLGIPLSSWQKSGLAYREKAYYQRFTHRQHSVSLLTYGKQDQQYADFWEPIKILPWLGKITHFVKYALFAVFYHRKAFRQANIVKSNQSQGSLVGFLGKFINPKLKFVVRCGWVRTKDMIIQEENRTGLKLKRALFFEWLGFKLADAIIVVTESDANYIVEHYRANRKKITVIPNSIDTDQYQYQDNHPDFSKSANILLVGRLVEMKNFHKVFEAISRIDKDISINIVGEGSYKTELERYAQKFNVKAKFIGNVANDKLASLYNQHDLVLMTEAYGSGMPKVVLESMAAGTTILASNIRSVMQFLRNSENGFICKPETDDIERGLVEIFNTSPEKLSKIREQARQEVEQLYSMDACVEKELTLYQKLLNK